MSMRNNLFAHVKPEKPLPVPGWGLPNSVDKRPRLALVVGDGFFQGFLSDMGCREQLPCTIQDLIPGHGRGYFLNDSQWAGRPIWDESRWPLLAKFVNKHSGLDFYKAIVDEIVNEDSSTHGFVAASVQYEYRCYLWYYFKWVNYSLGEYLVNEKKNWNDWAFFESLARLSRAFSVSFISFNYDMMLQGLFRAFSIRALQADFRSLSDEYDHIYAHLAIVVPLHGSLAMGYDFPGYVQVPEFWKSPAVASHNMVSRAWYSPVRYDNAAHPPSMPTIIPPGCSGSDMTIPSINSQENAKFLIKNADGVIVYGLSGDGVDEPEVRELLGVVGDNARVIHVGLPGRDENESVIARWRLALQNDNRSVEFVNAEDSVRFDKAINCLIDDLAIKHSRP